MDKQLSHICRYKRLEFDGVPIYIYPEKPDWFIPTERADYILRLLLAGKSVYEAAKAESIASGQKVEQLIFLIGQFMSRITGPEACGYDGRYDKLSLDTLKECWFHITNRCNLECRHCMFCSGPSEKLQLTREQLVSSIREAERLGCEIFYFTGGEPFMYEGLADICEEILEKHTAHLVILTNGIGIKKFRGWLLTTNRKLLHLQVSLDGLRDNHDAIRGTGNFAKVVDSIKFLQGTGCNTTLAMAVTNNNVTEMSSIVELAGSLKIKNVHYLWLFRKGKESGANFVGAREIGAELLRAYDKGRQNNVLIDNIEIIRSQVFCVPGTRYDLTNAGWQSLAVGPEGKIYPSPALVGEEGLAAGGISEGIETVWKNSAVLEKVRQASLVDSDNYRKNPLRFFVGGGDIDHSYISSGKLAGYDPYVHLYNQVVLKLLAEAGNNFDKEDSVGMVARMGEYLYQCGQISGEAAFTHSNCVLTIGDEGGSTAVKSFYTEAAEKPKAAIFNPVRYEGVDLSFIPEDARIRCYGCGSPVLDCDLKVGESVADLGSGTGVECFIAAKQVGSRGKVYGIDMTDKMLEIAEKAKQEVVKNLGYDNVNFIKGFLEDTTLESETIDAVISNCVINLSSDKRKTFREIFRILKNGGRLVISDITYDEDISLSIKYNEKLRGECIGGALGQSDLFSLLADVGFEAAKVVRRFFYREVEGHRFFSITYSARKPAEQRSTDIMYRGPFAAVITEDGQILARGITTQTQISKNLSTDESLFTFDTSGNVSNIQIKDTCTCFDKTGEVVRTTLKEHKYSTGCMVCGAEIEYLQLDRQMRCCFCGKKSYGNSVCNAGHFVCDDCHASSAISVIKKVCLAGRDTDMLALMEKIRSHPRFPMHGPEHHCMVPAVILTVYKNVSGKLSKEHILTAIDRGKGIAGGSCAFWGICGAAGSVGIAFSLILGADPCTGEKRQKVQKATSEVLGEIAKFKAGRCCQRDCWVALKTAGYLSKRYIGVQLKAAGKLKCRQYSSNKECIKQACPLWPGRDITYCGQVWKRSDNPATQKSAKRPCDYKFSVIIPVLNEQDQINSAIKHLRCADAEAICEIIVVDGDRRRKTIKAIEDKNVAAITADTGRGSQMNAGAALAKAEILIFLHTDTRLPTDAFEKIRRVLANKEYVGGAFGLKIDSDRLFLKCIAALATLRCRLNRVPYGDQAVFIRRDYFEKIDKFKAIPLMEDVELMRRIKKSGDKIVILPDCVRTSARRWETEGAVYTTIRNQVLVGLYRVGFSPYKLARFYRLCSNSLVKYKNKSGTTNR